MGKVGSYEAGCPQACRPLAPYQDFITTQSWPLSRVSKTRLSRERGIGLHRLRNFLFDDGQASVEIILVKHREYSLGDDFQLEDWKDRKPQYDLGDSFGPSSAWWVLTDALLRRHLA